MTDPEFPGVEFDWEWPHKCGNVLCKALSNKSMRWGIRGGSSYPPERHIQGHRLTIERGRGVVSINGDEQLYAEGNWFDIAANVPHGFMRVDESTLVLQEDY